MRATSILVFGLCPCSIALMAPQQTLRQNSCELRMGLYDSPLPSKENEDEEIPLSARRLFNFKLNGTESRGLLPPLSRSLDSGIGCSFEPSDPEVTKLAEKTNCNIRDAAWALDACQGDAAKAEQCIEAARAKFMNDPSPLSSQISGFDLRKAEQMKKQSAKKGRIIIGPPKPGEQDWLPIKNPTPIDDEPWFTG